MIGCGVIRLIGDDLARSTGVGSFERLTLAFFVLCLAFIMGFSQAGINGQSGNYTTNITINSVSYHVFPVNASRAVFLPSEEAGTADYSLYFLLIFLVLGLVAGLLLTKRGVKNGAKVS